ncbi:MAG: hypothetical protein WCP08_08005 [Prolixibacteraceae bacterium]
MAKFKKENKELLSYLLFESGDESTYVKEVKAELDDLFIEVKKGNSYLAKKTIRKILGMANKYIKYSGSKQTEVEILIHFCKKLRKSGIPLPINTALGNIYLRQITKIKKSLATLHEDLQFDYSDDLRLL